jgi:hypothetical protein
LARIHIPALNEGAPEFYHRAIVSGYGGQGKTPLITTLPDDWYPAIYWAADPTSPGLDSILPEDKERIVVVTPNGWVDRFPDERWYDEATAIARAEWETWGSGCDRILGKDSEGHSILERLKRKMEPPRTIILDTLSMMAEAILHENARQLNSAGDQEGGGHSQIGRRETVAEGGGGVTPARPDYNSVQGYTHQILTWLFKRKMHVIVGAQEGEGKPPMGTNQGHIIGPVSVGTGSIRQIAQRFATVMRVTRQDHTLTVQLCPEGPIVASVKANPAIADTIPRTVKLENSADARRAFWMQVTEYKTGSLKKEESVAS